MVSQQEVWNRAFDITTNSLSVPLYPRDGLLFKSGSFNTSEHYITDSSGNNNNLLFNSPCLYFDGSTKNKVYTTEGFTTAKCVTGRFKTSTSSANYYRMFTTEGNGSNTCVITYSSDKINFVINTSAGDNIIITSNTFSDGEEHFFVCNKTEGKIYVDGVEQTTTLGSVAIGLGGWSSIGSRITDDADDDSDTNTVFNGCLWDIRVFSADKNSTERATIMSGGDVTADLLAHYPCTSCNTFTDGSTGNVTIPDISGNNYHMTVGGTAMDLSILYSSSQRSYHPELYNGNTVYTDGTYNLYIPLNSDGTIKSLTIGGFSLTDYHPPVSNSIIPCATKYSLTPSVALLAADRIVGGDQPGFWFDGSDNALLKSYSDFVFNADKETNNLFMDVSWSDN